MMAVLVMLTALGGCGGLYPDYEPPDTDPTDWGDDDPASDPDPDPNPDNTEPYLTYQDYGTLLDALENTTNIGRTQIDQELSALNVTTDYEYSFYSGGTYHAHTMNWRSYNSSTGDWYYYIDVDIWVDESGNLVRDMCSYYSG